MNLHPLIDDFPLGHIDLEPGFYTYFTGAKFKRNVPECFPRAGLLPDAAEGGLPPKFGELDVKPEQELFEFIPLFEAVAAAEGEFSMIDLGAGYGLWSVHAACLARRRGIPFRLAMVEGEPRHFELLRQALADNGISEERCDLYPAAVEAQDATIGSGSFDEALVPFIIGRPSGSAENASPWIGQSTGAGARMFCDRARKTDRLYYGKHIYEMADGWQLIHLPLVSLRSILEQRDRVDLLVMDIQGSELATIKSCKDSLSRRVGRVSVGTHSADMESGIRDIFASLGWEKLQDFTHGGARTTPLGQVTFEDGLLYFRNPDFAALAPDRERFLAPMRENAAPDPSGAGFTGEAATPVLSRSGVELARLWEKVAFRGDAGQAAFRIADGICQYKPAVRQDYVALVNLAVPIDSGVSTRLRFEFTFPENAPGTMHWYARISDGDWNQLGDSTLRGNGNGAASAIDFMAESGFVNVVLYPLDGNVWHTLPICVAICGFS